MDLVPASPVDGRWVAAAALAEGDTAFVDRGGVVDSYGEINGAPTSPVGSGTSTNAAGSSIAAATAAAPDATTTTGRTYVRGVPVAAVATASSLLGFVTLGLLIVANRKRVVG